MLVLHQECFCTVFLLLPLALDPENGSLTARFKHATAFYIHTPFKSIQLEIDVFLQVYFPVGIKERSRNLALGKLKDGQIKLNEVDTKTVVPIPNEFVDSNLEMALFFLSSDTTYLEVFVLTQDCKMSKKCPTLWAKVPKLPPLPHKKSTRFKN